MLASPFSVLGQSFRLYRANLWVLVGYSAWLLFPIAGIFVLSFIPDHTWVTYASVSIFTIAQMLISIWLSIVFIKLVDLMDRKQPLDLPTVQKESIFLLRPTIHVMARQFLFVFLGFIALIIPGIVMALWYAFSQMALILDGKIGMEALTFSKTLVKGRFFQVLYRLIAGPLIIGFVYSFFIAILFLIIASSSGIDLIQAMSGNTVPAWIELLQSSLEIFTIPLVATYMTMLYKELRKNPVIAV